MLIDTHCHLTHERYAGEVDQVLQRAAEEGVGAVVSIASDLNDAAQVAALAAQPRPGSAQVFATVGVHPHEAAAAPTDLRGRLHEALADPSGPLAIGECGLDYHYDFSPPATQRKVFQLQLEVAEAEGLPVVVHCREAEEEMTGIVREAGAAGIRGVIHCFPGHLELLDAAMESGWSVSFTGLVTFRSFEGEEAVRRVPSDRYMLETDGPYMAPVPHRGKRNEPAWVPFLRDRVAELRGVEADRVEEETTANARTFFGLPHDPIEE
ncbi:MAG: TatD family hydrolase [Gemmatimonadota bacterium]